jgi:flagella basal body P-ring formation protein FlgA
MSGKYFFKPLVILTLFWSCLGVANAERQSLASITLQVESFLANFAYDSPYPAQFDLAKLDKRLNLKPCAQALDVQFTRTYKTTGNTSLTVRCKAPVSWQIHLPVRVSVFDDVVVNKIPLVKGQKLDTYSIEYRKKDITRLQRGYFQRTQPLDNLQAKRNLPAGNILNTSNLSLRQLVKSGQRVIILLDVDGLQIKTSGLALQSASLGQVIKVKNTQSNKIVEGVVSAAGEITVNL